MFKSEENKSKKDNMAEFNAEEWISEYKNSLPNVKLSESTLDQIINNAVHVNRELSRKSQNAFLVKLRNIITGNKIILESSTLLEKFYAYSLRPAAVLSIIAICGLTYWFVSVKAPQVTEQKGLAGNAAIIDSNGTAPQGKTGIDTTTKQPQLESQQSVEIAYTDTFKIEINKPSQAPNSFGMASQESSAKQKRFEEFKDILRERNINIDRERKNTISSQWLLSSQDGKAKEFSRFILKQKQNDTNLFYYMLEKSSPKDNMKDYKKVPPERIDSIIKEMIGK